MEKIKVLYIFDKYLNRTMNWAHRIIKFTPNIEPIIASPLIVKNEFYEAEWRYIHSPYQWEKPKDEWGFSGLQIRAAQASVKLPFLYKSFLKKKIKEVKPDLIHIHFGNVAWEYLALAKDLNIPLIATFHGYDYQRVLREKPVFYARYKELFENAVFITSGGTRAREYLVSLGAHPEKTLVVPMSIEVEKISFPLRKKEKNSLNLLQVSSFVEKKGHLTTLLAFKKALSACKNIKLTFIGEFVDKRLLKQVRGFISANHLDNVVTILPSMPYADLVKQLNDFDVFIHPSQTSKNGDTECTPVSIMDAQCAGMPVIATRHADIPDLVIEGKTGILATEKDIPAISKAILKFAHMEEKEMSSWRNNARSHISKKFNISKAGVDWSKLYKHAKNK